MTGQDEALVDQREGAPAAQRAGRWRPEYDESRTTVAVGLRLAPEDALALRVAARANARTISAHVARLVAVRGDPVKAQRDADPLADAASLTAAMVRVPNEVRRLRSDLASLGGLVKSLFIRSESVGLAQAHAQECSRALAALTAAAEAAVPVLDRVEAELADVRIQLAEVVARLAGDR